MPTISRSSASLAIILTEPPEKITGSFCCLLILINKIMTLKKAFEKCKKSLTKQEQGNNSNKKITSKTMDSRYRQK